MTDEITAADISSYLETQSDFALEQLIYRSLLQRGMIEVTHGGTYADPVTKKFRQFDIRAMRVYDAEVGVSMAIECKSLTREFPLVVLRVPRPASECDHELLDVRSMPDGIFGVHRRRRTDRRGIYRVDERVGKSATQIRRNVKKENKIESSDSETYDKWSQALSSADALIRQAYKAYGKHGARGRFVTFIVPILVVSDWTLWVVRGGS
jgi:hypothetical protein